jgi:curli biogenesis system outer membrane secretion channel CsgG
MEEFHNMPHLARHLETVVRIPLLMVCLCILAAMEWALPSQLFAGALKVSWDANTEPDLAGYKIYYGQSANNYTTTINVGNVTLYTVDQLTEGVTYYFVVTAYDLAGNESGFSTEVSALVPSSDRTPPSVLSVRIIDGSTVEVKFSESVSKASAENKANYTIDNGIVVSRATLQPDNRTVILATGAHQSGKTYRITIQKIADRAPVPNVMAQAASLTYSFQAVDRTPPVATNFRAVNQQSLEVVFDEPVTSATATNTANYAITPSVTVLNASLLSDNRTVVLTTSTHAFGVSYSLSISGIADRAPTPNIMLQPSSFTYSFQSVDNTPPVVANVRIVNRTTVEVLFSEPVTKASAQSKANYAIDKGVVISSATLQADTRTVHLATSEHAEGETYTLTVRSVADRATPTNTMPQAVTFQYIYQTEDRRPPEVNSVTLTDLTHLLIVFNEPISQASAANVSNYRISDDIQVFEARLADNGLEVTLLTSPHQYNKDYTIVILNIEDRSPATNTLTASPRITYFLVDNPNRNYSGLGVNGLYPARYVLDSLRVGDAYYIDRPYQITQIPTSKRGLLWIKTANDDRSSSAEQWLEFTLTREANVWVAFDSRAIQAPYWLKDNFTRTNEAIGVSESARKLTLWKAHYLPGRVVLGGTMAPGAQADVTLSMYIVLIEDLQGPRPENSPTPQRFALYQNYPNPFSAAGGVSGRTAGRTEIRFYLDEAHHVELTVRNMLGQPVRTLSHGVQPPGTHTAFWDGRDDNGDLLPSGSYLCTLEVRDEIKSGRLTMAASLSRQTRVMTLLK